MGIIFKGNVNNGDTEQPRQPVSAKRNVVDQQTLRSNIRPSAPAQTRESPAPQQQFVRSHPRQYTNTDDHYLVVEGKEKKIGKQSRYILDMLTIED